VHFLANDDIATPTALVGKKVAPIFQAGDLVMGESLDIIAKVDTDPKYGKKTLVP
jgi:glutaredoxin 2